MSTQLLADDTEIPEGLAVDRMPDDLKDRGWRLQRKIVNDDEEHPDFVAHNEALGLTTEPFPLSARAIAEARKMDHGANRPIGFQHLPIENLRTDGGTQPRGELDLEVVDRYADEMENEAQFPPVIVFHDGSLHWLADGFHRLFAAKKAGQITIRCDVKQGTQRDAILYSLGANAEHGLPRSNEDKRRAVATLLVDPEWSEWSDNVIAGKTAVSQPFVSKLRRELSQNVLSEESDDQDAPLPQPTKRRGADGFARETKNIGRSPRARASVSQAETDIQIEATPAERSKPQPHREADQATPWPTASLRLNLQIKGGKGYQRPVTLSGSVADEKPIFLGSYTLADLAAIGQSTAIADLLQKLNKTHDRNVAKTKAKAAAK
jgi:ParB-like chromosome segregation protein Spo0J